MKVYEIVREERLDEVAPIVAGVAITQIISMVSAFLTAMSLMDLYKFIDNYGEDPESITDDQWFDVFLDVVLLVIPAFAKFGKPYLAKLIPNSWKKYAGDYVKGIVLKRLRADRAAANKQFGKGAQSKATSASARKDLKAKHAAAMQAAKARAAKSLQQLSGNAIYKIAVRAAGAGVIASAAQDYWQKYSQLEEDWIAYQNGDRETATFGDMDPAAAEKHAYELKKKLIGEATVIAASTIASLALGRRIQMFGDLVGKISGKGLVGGLVQAPFEIAAALVKIGGPGIAMFMQTDTGKKFLENQFVSAITSFTGSAVVNTWDFVKKELDLIAKSMGYDLGLSKPTAATIKRPEFKHPDPNGILITSDPANPKLKYIGGDTVTDPNTGYLLNNIPELVQDIRRRARAAKVADPVSQIPRDPSKQYSDLPV